jgi:hypothetical protein
MGKPKGVRHCECISVYSVSTVQTKHVLQGVLTIHPGIQMSGFGLMRCRGREASGQRATAVSERYVSREAMVEK